MAHPQKNFSSNFQGAQPLDAKLDIKINGESNEYQPSGEDKTVEVVEPIIFEASDSPTFAEVNEAIGKHVPVYIHMTGTGTDYMIPYVGQSNTPNQFHFEMPDAAANGIRYYIVRNGTGPDTGVKEFPKDRGYVQINRRWSDSSSPAKVKLCELTLASILSNNCYTFALSMALVLTNNGSGDCPCESGVFDLAVNILSSGNVYRAEGRWHGYSYDGHENHQARVIEDITVAWSSDHTKLEVWASLSKYFTGASSLSVSALLNQGSYYNRATSSGLTELKNPWQFDNGVKFITSAVPDPTYTLSTFVTKLDSDILELYIEDPESTGMLYTYYAMVTSGAYKTSALKYGSDPAYSIAYLVLSGTTTAFVNYNTSTNTITVFDVSPTQQGGYHAITKTEHTLGSTDVYKATILDPVTSGMTVEQFSAISSNTYKTAILEYSMGGGTAGEAILVSKGSNGLVFAVYASGPNKVVVFEVATSIVNGVHPITRTEQSLGGGASVFVATYDDQTDVTTYPDPAQIVSAITSNENVLLSYRSGTQADVYYLSGHDDGYFEFTNSATGRKISATYDEDTLSWGWELSESEVGSVVETVEDLATDLDAKVTTTFPFAQITTQSDFAGFGVTNTTRMIGQLFAVPIASEIRQDETLLCVNALQAYNGNVSFGIFEYDFEANNGQGSTYWIADTGVVSVQAGENEFPLTLVNNGAHKLQSSKLYYLVVAIDGAAPNTGLMLAACPNYSANVNASPKYTLVVSNMDSFVDWTDGHLNATWFQGYNEDHSVPRLFAMLRNGESQPAPTPGPFTPIDSFTLEHIYRVSDLFSITPDTNGLLFSKIIPAQTVAITKFRYVDYHGSINSAAGLPVLLDDTYTQLQNNQNGTWTLGDSDQTKIDGTHYVHEFTFQTPVTLQANTPYWILTGGNLSNQGNEWLITYQTPTVARDLLLVKNGYNVNPYIIAGGDGEFQSQQPGMYIQLTDDNNNTWTI